MTMQTTEGGPFEALPRERPFVPRVGAKTVSIVVAIAKRIVDEIVCIYREDRYHGQIERIPEDWER